MPASLFSTTDPIVFARDANNDLIIPLRKASGLEAVLILVRCNWLLWRDEWFLDRDAGTGWIETDDGVVTERAAILGQPYDAAKLSRELRGVALAVTGVIDVQEFRSAFDGETRNVTVSATIVSRFGSGQVSILAGI